MNDPMIYGPDGQQRTPAHEQAALLFDAMAKRVRHNQDSTFGGCFVIVPPESGGDAMDTLILDNKGNPAQFWMILQARSKMELEKLEAQERLGQSYGR